ncbi:MAG: hypothetical protein GX591_11900 [Planctomycetes bacterium]|nr:hypothetical protein [Planctomycetota bacterium]
MAPKTKKPDNAAPEAAQPAPDRLVRVLVKRAISDGGMILRPTVDGRKLTPTPAVIRESLALRHGPAAVQVLGAAGPDDAALACPADRAWAAAQATAADDGTS